jgi:hypothetical protein
VTASSQRAARAHGQDALHSVADRSNAAATGAASPRDGACFSKHFAEEWLFRATLHNSLRAWAAARRSSWLRTPEVLHADRQALRIDYELLSGWTPLHRVVRRYTFGGLTSAELLTIFWTIGAALEEFHRRTHRIHGDFDLDNILVQRGAGKVVLVDFTPPEYARFRGYNQADPYVDIATLLLYVLAKYPPQRLYLAFRPQLRGLARAFIAGYFRRAPDAYDQQSLERSIEALLANTYLGASFTARYLRRSRLFRTDDLAPVRDEASMSP